MIFFVDNSRRVQPVDSIDLPPLHGIGGGSGLWSGGGGQFLALSPQSNGGGAVSTPAPAAPPIDFDFDLGQIGRAIERGNTREDVLSAYEVFTTGSSRGRGLGYAQDVQRRFGAPSLRHAAASYLDAAGLPRLARIVSPDPTPTPQDELPLGDFFELPFVGTGDPVAAPAPTSAPAPKGPVELLLDAIPRLFGNAVVNPPLQSQATSYTPVSGDFGGGAGGIGGNIGTWLLLGGVAIAGYFIYRRYKRGAGE